MGNSTHCHAQTPYPIITKSCVCDYVLDIYRRAKYSQDHSRVFFPVCAKLRIKIFTGLIFLGSSNTPHPRPPNRFSRVIRQMSLSNDLSGYSIKCFLQIYKSKVELLSFHPYFSCIRRTVKIASVVHFPGRDCILISCRKYDGCPPF